MTVELVHASRNRFVENIYRGDVVVVNDKGDILFELGNGKKTTYWRSSAKPFQVLPFVEAGGMETFQITGEELALMCASHGGEPEHVEKVRALLEKIGFAEEDLRCGAASPMYQPAAKKILQQQQSWTALHNCCSGKHTGMLAMAALKNYPREKYEAIAHPVQQEALQVAADFTEMEAAEIGIGVDGCGAPIYYLALDKMAKAYARLSKPEAITPPSRAEAMTIIGKAMTDHAWYVAGTGRLDTVLMEVSKGRLLAKLGADGVYCVSVMGEGIGISLKIESGVIRAIEPVIVELLRRLSFISDAEALEMEHRLDFAIYNHRKEVIGVLKPVF
ncbi:L-asparaginase II [Tindallia magadiensis]|uniref:L-asparaginase II n=1 Tax=Tindallia magadiensis TaxID=69895 RepID=A0A1I3HCF5_9FIRM|nr:asparaginase [Tindallia magadiensis]SFI33415.1 L-asparaginase II [Tindallia magadiensis]